MNNIIKYTFALLLLILFSTCTETILRDDCASLSEIELTLKAEYATDCEPNQDFPASGAGFKMIVGSDTLFAGNLNNQGIFETGPIANSSCGLNNVRIEATYRGKSIIQQFGVLCCDTLLAYRFENVWCDVVEPISCEALDTSIVKTITSSGECILQNAPFDQLQNNHVLIVAPGPLQINTQELESLTGKIYLENISPRPDNNIVKLNEGQMLEIYFNVIRDEIIEIPAINIELPVSCTDDQGNTLNSGTINITLDATVCDPNVCYCPFGESDRISTYYASEPVTAGSNQNFNFTIAELNDGNFGDGCILKIDRIVRADGSDAYNTENGAWTILSASSDEMIIGDELSIDANFAPPTAENFTEEFWVYTSVYSSNNPNEAVNTDECKFSFKLNGDGCEQLCPQLQVFGNNVQVLNQAGTVIDNLNLSETIDFDPQNTVSQQVTGIMSTKCLDNLQNNGNAFFAINLPQGSYCGNIELHIEKLAIGESDDRNKFSLNEEFMTISDKGGKVDLRILFETPDLNDHYSEEHNELYQCQFNVIAISANTGQEVCRQNIKIEARVEEFSVGSRDVIPMEAFSQVSVQASEPSYHVYLVDRFNETLGNYGIRESLTRTFIDFSGTVRKPMSNHTLYFDVASPNNPALNHDQKPRLFLVNSDENEYSEISATAVANFTTPDAFFEAYESGQLALDIFNSGTPYTGNWTNRTTKQQVDQNGGINIQPGEVYLLWDPNGSSNFFNEGGQQREIFCSMALIYISSVKSGDDNTTPETGGNGKASVSFYVQYPIKH
ncbi:MAG: hypothetical protein JW735_13340 [Prolixibacteraceae bacterium]|nr:hypothetical protein [Prolixibacteraceae bacterium]